MLGEKFEQAVSQGEEGRGCCYKKALTGAGVTIVVAGAGSLCHAVRSITGLYKISDYSLTSLTLYNKRHQITINMCAMRMQNVYVFSIPI